MKDRGRKSKKFIVAILTVVVLSAVATTIYSSAGKILSQTILVNTNQNSLLRFLSDDIKTKRWWASCKKTLPGSRIDLAQFHRYYSGNLIGLKVKMDGSSINSEMQVIPATSKGTYLRWQLDQSANKNFFNRMAAILNRDRNNRTMKKILLDLKAYSEKAENIYGSLIQKTKVEDTLLVVSKSVCNTYPGITYVYNQITQLRKYISSQNLREKNYPMLYVLQAGVERFEVSTAIPVNRHIKSIKAIVMQRMVAGDILWTECKGGPSTIRKSFKDIENYMLDYQYSSPALPFELLIVDRLKETDTSKWITRVYYPVY